MKKSGLKKLGVGVGVFFILILAAIITVPWMVDVDKYRPQMIDIANQNIRGKLDLGKLSLSLWGQVRIRVEGLNLLDAGGQPVLQVKDASFHLPFLSVLSGSPVLTFQMNQPNVFVVKNRAGKLNVMSLVQPQSDPSAKSHSSQVGQSSAGGGGDAAAPALPGIATRARLGIELRSAQVTYKDEKTGMSTVLNDVNFKLKDLSLSHPIELESWADLDFKWGQTAAIKGPFTLKGKAQLAFHDGKLDQMGMTAELDMDSVEISAPGIFDKKKGMKTRASVELNASEKEVQIAKAVVQFFNFEVQAEGRVSEESLRLSFKSNEVPLKPWSELLPMLKQYDLAGTAYLDASVSGTPAKPEYRSKIKITGLTAQAPQLKTQPKIDALVSVVTGQLDQVLVTMAAPGNDLKLQGKVTSFSPVRAQFEVSSTGMDLDQLYRFPPKSPPSAAGKAEAESTEEKVGPSKTPAPDYDAMLAPLRENSALNTALVGIGIRMKSVKATGISISNIACQFTFKDLAAHMEQCGLKVFSGDIKAESHIQLRPKTPTYQWNAQVSGFDLNQAVESQMEAFKNTVTGKAQFAMKAQGMSFNPNPAIANLKASGNMRIDQARFATVDIAKMVNEGLSEAVDKLGEKVPAAKGKKVNVPLPKGGSQYEFFASDFVIDGGKFSAPHFEGKAVPNQGIDLKGTVTVGMKDRTLDTTWEVIDTYNLTRARDLSVEHSGVKVDHILAEGDGAVHFPIHVGCTLKSPCYSYTEVGKALTQVALNNVGKAVGERAKQEVKKHAESLIQQVAPTQLKDSLKGLFR